MICQLQELTANYCYLVWLLIYISFNHQTSSKSTQQKRGPFKKGPDSKPTVDQSLDLSLDLLSYLVFYDFSLFLLLSNGVSKV